jgi:ABC-type transporter Mla MlaB component
MSSAPGARLNVQMARKLPRPRAAPPPLALGFTVHGPIARDDLPGLCDRVRQVLVRRRSATVMCDVAGVEADAVTVEALARLQLAARRHGCLIRMRHASAELRQLVAFMGLEDVLPD